MYHKDLEAWKKSIEFVSKIYKITQTFPVDEKFGLSSQMRRAAVSIPSNIAEGCARNSDKDSIRFFDIAYGSLAELETQLIISEQLGYITNLDNLFEDINDLFKLLSGLKRYLKTKKSE